MVWLLPARSKGTVAHGPVDPEGQQVWQGSCGSLVLRPHFSNSGSKYYALNSMFRHLHVTGLIVRGAGYPAHLETVLRGQPEEAENKQEFVGNC